MIWRILAVLAAVLALVGALTFVGNRIHQAGWDARDAIAQRQDKANADAALATLAKNTADAAARDAELSAQLAGQKIKFDSTEKALRARLQAQQTVKYVYITKEGTPDEASEPAERPPLIGQSVLDDGTVRLLNDARAGRNQLPTGSAPAGGNEAGGALTVTAPFVTGVDFALNDLKVVQLYHELAARHDTLVDWVVQQCVKAPANPTNDQPKPSKASADRS
jgi:hypothetical protein